MTVIQNTFEIPLEINEKLLSGEYNLFGGVVREAMGRNKGRIVKMLDPVNVECNIGQVHKMNLLDHVRNNKKTIIAAAILCTLATGGYIYKRVKEKPKDLTGIFQKAFNEYIEHLRHGTLNKEIINAMISMINEIENSEKYNKIENKTIDQNFKNIVDFINDHTMVLADDNEVQLSDEDKYTIDNPLLELKRCLNIQKRIFEIRS